ncbi:MAG: hypothetical protein OXH73_13615 [Caldilineaceae bacterium]|nr:hypothetical protein [Caldilineaceae bacterium]
MFYYYGRKKQFAKYYPEPLCDCIVEPFAGSAAYSLYKNNWKKKVVLVEKDERVASIWKWFIEEAKPQDFHAMPDLQIGEKSSEFLCIIHAATKMAFNYKTIKVTPILARNWEISKRVMAENVHKLKNWKIICGDYSESPDVEATWFIDPPYKEAPGQGYRHGSDSIDYNSLAQWVKRRRGQIICCEGEFGDYLPFKPLLVNKGVAGKKSKELIYYRTDCGNVQLELFSEPGLPCGRSERQQEPA